MKRRMLKLLVLVVVLVTLIYTVALAAGIDPPNPVKRPGGGFTASVIDPPNP